MGADVIRERDRLLDKISELIAKRDATLMQLSIWEESDPALVEMIDDIRLQLM